MRIAVVVPVKSFRLAKGRLAGVLDAARREELARECAARVVAAAAPHRVYVVCDDDEVERWAREHGASPVRCDAPGLDVAVSAGRRVAATDGAEHLIVAHADLPLARRLDHVVRPGAVTLVPDRHRDGTNVLAFPLASSFSTAYGPGSWANHLRAAGIAGLPVETIEDADLALDLDDAADLDELARRRERDAPR